MKGLAAVLFAVVVAHSAAAHAGVNVNIGMYPAPPVVVNRPPAVVYQPAPVHYRAPQPAPRFVYSPDLGFYVSDNPYDIAYIGRTYYMHRAGYWHAAPSYDGPWVVVKRYALPRELRRFDFREVSYYRDRACGHHMEYRDEHRGRWHPERDRWDHRRERW